MMKISMMMKLTVVVVVFVVFDLWSSSPEFQIVQYCSASDRAGTATKKRDFSPRVKDKQTDLKKAVITYVEQPLDQMSSDVKLYSKLSKFNSYLPFYEPKSNFLDKASGLVKTEYKLIWTTAVAKVVGTFFVTFAAATYLMPVFIALLASISCAYLLNLRQLEKTAAMAESRSVGLANVVDLLMKSD